MISLSQGRKKNWQMVLHPPGKLCAAKQTITERRHGTQAGVMDAECNLVWRQREDCCKFEASLG